MSQISLTQQPTAPFAPSSGKVRIFVGADGILRSIDSNGVVTNYEPQGTIGSFLQYSNSSNLVTSSTSGVAIPLNTDRSSSPGTLLTKLNATDFRVNANCFIYAKYNANPFSGDNDRGYGVFIRQNATDLTWTRMKGWSKNQAERSAGVSGSFIIQCSVNDVIQFRLYSEEGSAITLAPNLATVSIEIFKLA